MNTRASLKDKLRICQRARASILSSLAKRVGEQSSTVNQSAALLDLTLRQLHLQTELGEQQAVAAEVESLLRQAANQPSESQNGGLESRTEQLTASDVIVFLSALKPSDSVVLWVSCAHLLAYGVLPQCTASRLGFEQVLVSPEEAWQADPSLQIIQGSEFAVLQVYQVAASDFSVRAGRGTPGDGEEVRAWRLGLHSLASHRVAATTLVLGVDEALAMCDLLLKAYPDHTDLAYRRAMLLLRARPATNGHVQRRTDTEIDEALKCLQTIAMSHNLPPEDVLGEAKEADRYLAVLRCAELLLEWRTKEAALRFLEEMLREAPKESVETLCCGGLQAHLMGDGDRAKSLAKAAEALARSRENIRLVAQHRATYSSVKPLGVTLEALTTTLQPGTALELRPLAPPWEEVSSGGLRKQVRHAWWGTTAWDYSLLNQVIFAWLPELAALVKGGESQVWPSKRREAVSTLEHLLRSTPGNVALSLASGKLCQSTPNEYAILSNVLRSWSVPLVTEALILAQPTPQGGLWEHLAMQCQEVGEEKAAEELRVLSKRLGGRW